MEHHVYFWLKEDRKTTESRAAFERGLASLFQGEMKISGRWAVPAKVAPRPVLDQSWDYALSIQFSSVEEHDIYQDDPTHKAFINTFRESWAKVLVMDLA